MKKVTSKEPVSLLLSGNRGGPDERLLEIDSSGAICNDDDAAVAVARLGSQVTVEDITPTAAAKEAEKAAKAAEDDAEKATKEAQKDAKAKAKEEAAAKAEQVKKDAEKEAAAKKAAKKNAKN